MNTLLLVAAGLAVLVGAGLLKTRQRQAVRVRSSKPARKSHR